MPILMPTSKVDLATDTTGARTISPMRMPEHPVTLARRGTPVTVDGVVYSTGFPDLVPSSTVDLATDSTFSTQNVSPTRMPATTISSTAAGEVIRTESATVICQTSASGSMSSIACPSESISASGSPVTVEGIVYPTGFPDLVPSTTVNMATDSVGGTQDVSPTRMLSTASPTTTMATAASSTAAGTVEDKKKGATSGAAAVRSPLFGMLMGVWMSVKALALPVYGIA